MSTTTTEPKRRRGRPGCLAFQFAAHLLAINSGQNERYCRALLNESVSELGSRGWALVALALTDGCDDLDSFHDWLENVGYFKRRAG